MRPLLGLHNTYASYDGKRMYVTAIMSKSIAEIDVASHAMTRVFSLSGQPRPAALRKDDRTLYVQLSELHGFVELDLASGLETRKIEWPDDGSRPVGYEDLTIPTKCHGIGLTPDESQLWAASNLQGNVRLYSVPALEELAVIKVGTLPNWIAFTKEGDFAYVTNTDIAAPHGTVSIISVSERKVIATIDVGKAPKRIHRVDLP
jgi:YVTN family beta-propeller protein